MSLEVSVEDYADDHLGPLFELFGTYFKPDDRLLTAAYTRWLYQANPFGLARMVRVSEGSRWVGFMAMLPVELTRRGEPLRAFYVVNVLVNPAFHGKFLFGRMITAAQRLVEKEDAALLGHPNDMALKSWQRARMHFHEPLRPSVAWPWPSARGMSARTVVSAGQLQASADTLADVASLSSSWRVAATPAYLDWRFLRHPSNTYHVQALTDHGSPAGVQVTKRVRPGVRLLVDQWVVAEHAKRATSLLPPLTLCFWPDSFTHDMSGAVWALPWKKRLPIFFTRPLSPEVSTSVARLGLSASDF